MRPVRKALLSVTASNAIRSLATLLSRFHISHDCSTILYTQIQYIDKRNLNVYFNTFSRFHLFIRSPRCDIFADFHASLAQRTAAMLGPKSSSGRQGRPGGKFGGREIRDRRRIYRGRQSRDQAGHVRGVQRGKVRR